MDRDTTIIMAATIIFLTLVGGIFLQPPAGARGGESRSTLQYKPEDIRYKFQQAEAKQGKKRKGKPASETTPAIDVGSENEEPTAEADAVDESAEEPEINE